MRTSFASHFSCVAWTIITTLALTPAALAEDPPVVAPPSATGTSDAEPGTAAPEPSQDTLPTGVNEESAREAALMLAAPPLEKGYRTRGKPWSGELRGGKPTDT